MQLFNFECSHIFVKKTKQMPMHRRRMGSDRLHPHCLPHGGASAVKPPPKWKLVGCFKFEEPAWRLARKPFFHLV